MEITKEQFGIEVTKLLKERKLTQKGLASHLGITAAAVCYLLKNQLRPSGSQFDGIMEYLQADVALINYLRPLWLKTQNPIEERNDRNVNLFSLRCEKNVSVEDVAASTGIPIERLRYLENKAGAEPTSSESALLMGYYGNNSAFLETGADEYSVPQHVADRIADEILSGTRRLPVLSLDVLSRVSKEDNLSSFLADLPFSGERLNVAPCHRQRAKAVVICDADEVHYGIPGTLKLVVADEEPGSADQIYLSRGTRGGFMLLQKTRRSLEYFGAEHPAPKPNNSWCLPVLEMNFSASPLKHSDRKNN